MYEVSDHRSSFLQRLTSYFSCSQLSYFDTIGFLKNSFAAEVSSRVYARVSPSRLTYPDP